MRTVTAHRQQQRHIDHPAGTGLTPTATAGHTCSMSLAWRPQLLHGVRLCVLATVLAGSPAAAEPPAALTSARDAYRRGNFLLAME